MSNEEDDDLEDAEAADIERPEEPADPISIRRVLFAMAVALVGCSYTLDVGPLRWAALCLGVAAEAFQPEPTPVRYWLAWLAYGAAGAYCQLSFGALAPWLALLPIGAMLASFVGQPLAERAALAAALVLPASLAPHLSLLEFAVRSAAFGGACWWSDRPERLPPRVIWILWVPTLSPLALVGALLYLGLTLHERKQAPAAATKPETDNRRAAPKRRSHQHGSKNHA